MVKAEHPESLLPLKGSKNGAVSGRRLEIEGCMFMIAPVPMPTAVAVAVAAAAAAVAY